MLKPTSIALIVQQRLADQSRHAVDEVNGMIAKLHNATLINIQQGPHGRAQIALT
jgi:hypothetical protein